MNIRGQTGLDEAKQLQIESFIKSNRIDILNCQEINIDDNSFNNCDFISSSYEIITNNARNKYGTCCILANDLGYENVKVDTNGRVIAFNIGNITFCNVYLPSGNDPLIRNSRENYAAEIIPQILINSKDMGCIGGDWNSIVENRDATKDASNQNLSNILSITFLKWTVLENYTLSLNSFQDIMIMPCMVKELLESTGCITMAN